jgi:hypothetical protein
MNRLAQPSVQNWIDLLEWRGARLEKLEAWFLCRQAFEFGSRAYEGRRIPAWEMMVCTSCYESNWDGIVPEAFPHLIPYLKSRGVEIKLNARGRIDWPT